MADFYQTSYSTSPDFGDLTHIGKLSGNDSGDFPETFSKKNILLYCDVTTNDN